MLETHPEHWILSTMSSREDKRKLKDKLQRTKLKLEAIAARESRKKGASTNPKPEIKLKCSVCDKVGHMRSSCPLYQQSRVGSSIASPQSSSVGRGSKPAREGKVETESLVKLDGIKFTISLKLLRQMERESSSTSGSQSPTAMHAVADKRGKSTPVGKRTASIENLDNLQFQKRNKVPPKTSRQRQDPIVAINSIFERIVNEVKEMDESKYFLLPVSTRAYPTYCEVIKKPMDLQSIKEKLRQNKYSLRSDFLADFQLIRDNSVKFNGEKTTWTEAAQILFETVKGHIDSDTEELEKLENLINPLLGGYQSARNYIFLSCLDKLKLMPESHPFLQPVDKRIVPNYYEHIKTPMSFNKMAIKIKANEYKSSGEFLADLQLIHSNASYFNGADSLFTMQAARILNVATDFLAIYQGQVDLEEESINSELVETPDAVHVLNNHDDAHGVLKPANLHYLLAAETQSSQICDPEDHTSTNKWLVLKSDLALSETDSDV